VELTVTHEGKVAVVAVSGNLEAATSSQLGLRLDGLLAAGEQQFVVDLAGVRFMDSSGIAVLVRLFKRVRIGHGDVRLSGAQPPVEKIIRLVRLDRVFDTYADCRLAVASFSEPVLASPARAHPH
jgi:anti-sigma B factor antagonist